MQEKNKYELQILKYNDATKDFNLMSRIGQIVIGNKVLKDYDEPWNFLKCEKPDLVIKNSLKDYLEKDAYVILARNVEDGELCGFATLHRGGKFEWIIDWVVVDNEYRDINVAIMLFKECMQFAKDDGGLYVILTLYGATWANVTHKYKIFNTLTKGRILGYNHDNVMIRVTD